MPLVSTNSKWPILHQQVYKVQLFTWKSCIQQNDWQKGLEEAFFFQILHFFLTDKRLNKNNSCIMEVIGNHIVLPTNYLSQNMTCGWEIILVMIFLHFLVLVSIGEMQLKSKRLLLLLQMRLFCMTFTQRNKGTLSLDTTYLEDQSSLAFLSWGDLCPMHHPNLHFTCIDISSFILAGQ